MPSFLDPTNSLRRPTQLGQEPISRFNNSIFTDFLKSSISTLPEFVGFDALEGVDRFRAEHPYLGAASEILPLVLPYGGWAKATTMIPRAAKFLGSIGSKEAPVLSGALREMARFAPLELGRTAISLGTGDNTEDIAFEGALNTAMAGGFGAVGGLLSAGGRAATRLPEISSEVNLNHPTPMQLRTLKEGMAAGRTKNKDADLFHINRLTKEIYSETPLKGDRHVGALDTGEDGKTLNRLFNQGSLDPEGDAVSLESIRNSSLVRRRLTPEDWDSQTDLQQALKLADFEGKEEFVQFPRWSQATNKDGAKIISRAVTNNLRKVGQDLWAAREEADGLFVMAKRVKPGDPQYKRGGEAFGKGDQWVMFKTDTPEKFAPLQAKWNKKLSGWAGLPDDYLKPIGVETHDAFLRAKQLTSLRNYNDIEKVGMGKWLDQMKKALKVDVSQPAAAGTKLYNFLRENLAPTVRQLAKSPRAAYVFNQAKMQYGVADGIAHGIMYGSQEPPVGKVFKDILLGTGGSTKYKGQEALKTLIDAADDKDLFDIWRGMQGIWDAPRIKEAAIRGEISQNAASLLSSLAKTTDDLLLDTQKLQELYGIKKTEALKGHIGLQHTWKGTHRVPIYSAENNRFITLAAAKTKGAALEEANDLVAKAAADGKKWKIGAAFEQDYKTDLTDLLEMARDRVVNLKSSDLHLANLYKEARLRAAGQAGTPSTLKQRTGVGGYIGDRAPWTKKEFEEIVFNKVSGMLRYQSELNVKNGLGDDLLKLAAEDPSMWNQVMSRLDDLKGVPGAFSKLQNDVVDKLFGDSLGHNSATKIVSTLNKFTHHFQLGMGNLQFPILNALSFMQTSLPQVAFVTKATREDLARVGYDWLPMVGSDGKPRGSMGFLSMMKLLKKSGTEMANPSSELLEQFAQGAREGVWSPRIMEEFVGQNSKAVTNMKEAWNQGVVKWIESASNIMPSMSERFSRAHSFTLGHIVGRDVMGLKGDSLYSFARQFTENTMFSYTTADRAKLINGPMGSLFGLYKHWQMNYLAWMMEYSGQAVNKGNVAPLLWMTGGTAATGGVAATPLWGAADMMSRALADKSAMQVVYDTFGPAGSDTELAADTLYYGLPAMLGVSLQGSASAPGANPIRDASMLMSFVQWDRARAIGRALGNAADAYAATGDNPINSPLVRDNVIRAIAPRSVFRAVQAAQDGFVKSLNTDYPVAQASGMERFLFGMGLSPVQVERQLAVSNEIWQDNTKLRTAIGAYGKSWAEMQTKGDWKGLSDLQMRAMLDGVPMDSIIRSANARLSKMEEDQIARTATQQKINEMSSVYRRRPM
jgi:hypothetical protein